MLNPSHLANLLDSHQASDALEAAHLARMKHLLAQGEAAFRRDAYAPGHFTASAFVASPDGRELLLIHHAKLARWLQPGGHLEPDDVTVAAAARRELAEEAGVARVRTVGEALLDVDVHRIPARGATPPHEHFDLRFAFVAEHRTVRAASDATAVRWVTFSELETIDSDVSVLRAAARLRRRLEG